MKSLTLSSLFLASVVVSQANAADNLPKVAVCQYWAATAVTNPETGQSSTVVISDIRQVYVTKRGFYNPTTDSYDKTFNGDLPQVPVYRRMGPGPELTLFYVNYGVDFKVDFVQRPVVNSNKSLRLIIESLNRDRIVMHDAQPVPFIMGTVQIPLNIDALDQHESWTGDLWDRSATAEAVIKVRCEKP